MSSEHNKKEKGIGKFFKNIFGNNSSSNKTSKVIAEEGNDGGEKQIDDVPRSSSFNHMYSRSRGLTNEAKKFIIHMAFRAKADELAVLEKNRGVDKLKMFGILLRRLSCEDPAFKDILIKQGFWSACLLWIVDYKEGVQQPQQIQLHILQLMQKWSPRVDEVFLLGIDLAVFMLYGKRQENLRVDVIAEELLLRWYFPEKDLTQLREGKTSEQIYTEIRNAVGRRVRKLGENPPVLPAFHAGSVGFSLDSSSLSDVDENSPGYISRTSSTSSGSGYGSRRNTKSTPKAIPGRDTSPGGIFDEINLLDFISFTEDGNLWDPDPDIMKLFIPFMRRYLRTIRIRLFKSAKEYCLGVV